MNCNLGPYTEKHGDKCYIPCRKGYKSNGDICDKISFDDVIKEGRDPIRARRMTICDPGWVWDGDRMCYPQCPPGFDTRDELCVSVPHSYRRYPRPRLYRAPATVSLPDFTQLANRQQIQADFKHVVGEPISDAKSLIRSMYPHLQIMVLSNKRREKEMKRQPDSNRLRLFFDPTSGLISHIPEIG